MKNKILQTTLLFVAIFTFSLTPYSVSAQDTGPIAMESITYYSLIGGGIGMVLGAAIWALDPLGPSSDIANSAYTGFALGSLIGAGWGFTILQEQAIIPYDPNNDPPNNSEFNGDFGQNLLIENPAQKRAMLLLFGMEYKF